MFRLLYRGARRIRYNLSLFLSRLVTRIKFKGNGVSYSSFYTGGIPFVLIARGGRMSIGSDFAMNNGIRYNPIGCAQPCTFFVDNGAHLSIGNNVGISQTTIIAHADITIEDNVKIGGGTSIYTSDFHSLDATKRASSHDIEFRVQKPVYISKNAFIGAHSIILKGVTIGENSIVGAGSVVTHSIPSNQVWAGNPARFISNIS